MQQSTPSLPSAPEPSAYLTLLAVQREIGMSRGTHRKYLMYLAIEPMCFQIGMCELSIARAPVAQVKQLKLNPALFVHLHLPSPAISRGSSEWEKN